MKYSIRKKMFLISLSTTAFSFLLILICFNFITSRHIEQQSFTELQKAVMMAETVQADIADTADVHISAKSTVDAKSLDPTSQEITTAVQIGTTTAIASQITSVLQKKDAEMEDIQFFLLDPSDRSVLYPTVKMSTVSLDRAPVADFQAKETEIAALQNVVTNYSAATPIKTTLNENSYYLMQAKIGDNTEAVFYKNVQSLEDLAADVNLALLVLLIVTGLITISVSMGLSSGMVRSIQKLCAYANAIGAGDLTPRELCLKEKELSILERDMNEMTQKLSDHDAEQKTFFQNVSHELRTPLMSIQGYAEGIAKHIFEKDEADGAAEIILAESDRLTEMVDNLLCLSRMDSKNRVEKKEKFECLEALMEPIEQAGALAIGKMISMHGGDGDFEIYGNREEFQKAILNILINCVRYAASQVEIECLQEERVIRISDDGPGILEKDLPHIFKRFYKGQGGCSGIGLAITETAVRNLGGTIAAGNAWECFDGEDQPENCKMRSGAVFTISLPS